MGLASLQSCPETVGRQCTTRTVRFSSYKWESSIFLSSDVWMYGKLLSWVLCCPFISICPFISTHLSPSVHLYQPIYLHLSIIFLFNILSVHTSFIHLLNIDPFIYNLSIHIVIHPSSLSKVTDKQSVALVQHWHFQ